ncbi:hypothetical protein QBC47DRAFT_56782 [Echria macrotheca]|uniref:Uncharacterized protein n=1 Tax=Echria macrotheca TaxID=438768 RepID=A0AAJ0F8Q3_9PEZI|nr:hypothetical protein QBC47DRAFT_56782 [Echria macrotheca]
MPQHQVAMADRTLPPPSPIEPRHIYLAPDAPDSKNPRGHPFPGPLFVPPHGARQPEASAPDRPISSAPPRSPRSTPAAGSSLGPATRPGEDNSVNAPQSVPVPTPRYVYNRPVQQIVDHRVSQRSLQASNGYRTIRPSPASSSGRARRVLSSVSPRPAAPPYSHPRYRLPAGRPPSQETPRAPRRRRWYILIENAGNDRGTPKQSARCPACDCLLTVFEDSGTDNNDGDYDAEEEEEDDD